MAVRPYSPFRTLSASISSPKPYAGLTFGDQTYGQQAASPFQSAYPAYGAGAATPATKPAPRTGAPPAAAAPPPNPYDPTVPSDFGGLDLAGDPILAQVRAYNQRVIAQAQADALAAKKRSLIEFGDPNLVDKTIADKNTATAAGQNPFSTIQQIIRAFNQNRQGIDTTRNAQNLFYSSTRANDLTNEGRNYLLNNSLAQGAVEKNLTGIDQQVLQAQQAAEDRWISALEDAYIRALQRQLAQGGGGGGGGGGGPNPYGGAAGDQYVFPWDNPAAWTGTPPGQAYNPMPGTGRGKPKPF